LQSFKQALLDRKSSHAEATSSTRSTTATTPTTHTSSTTHSSSPSGVTPNTPHHLPRPP
jgi:hypothetical protein